MFTNQGNKSQTDSYDPLWYQSPVGPLARYTFDNNFQWENKNKINNSVSMISGMMSPAWLPRRRRKQWHAGSDPSVASRNSPCPHPLCVTSLLLLLLRLFRLLRLLPFFHHITALHRQHPITRRHRRHPHQQFSPSFSHFLTLSVQLVNRSWRLEIIPWRILSLKFPFVIVHHENRLRSWRCRHSLTTSHWADDPGSTRRRYVIGSLLLSSVVLSRAHFWHHPAPVCHCHVEPALVKPSSHHYFTTTPNHYCIDFWFVPVNAS